jgi:hypothetical protein
MTQNELAAATVATPTNRTASRVPVTVPARLTWKDKRGMTRFASVLTRDVSESGVFVECPSEIAIQLYRLVQFQTERVSGDPGGLPTALRQGSRVLSAVYRITAPTKSGGRQGLGLRLIVEPKRAAASSTLERARATA